MLKKRWKLVYQRAVKIIDARRKFPVAGVISWGAYPNFYHWSICVTINWTRRDSVGRKY